MSNQVYEAIDELIAMIYSSGQTGINDKYIHLLNSLESFLNDKANIGIIINMNSELLELNEAYLKKDYTLLADIVLYKIKIDIDEIEKIN